MRYAKEVTDLVIGFDLCSQIAYRSVSELSSIDLIFLIHPFLLLVKERLRRGISWNNDEGLTSSTLKGATGYWTE